MTTPVNLSSIEPQNPYESYLVAASAGSGKTYQLSRRYLAMVIAGADPKSILALTFSRKAAVEMRERILGDAINMQKNPESYQDLWQQTEYFRTVKSSQQRSVLPPLRTLQEAAQLIIQSSQQLAVSTIDSIFQEWCNRFKHESAQELTDDSGKVWRLESPWTIPSNEELKSLKQDAWSQVMRRLHKLLDGTNDSHHSIIDLMPKSRIRAAVDRLDAVIQADTYIWLSKLKCGSPYIPYDAEVPGDFKHLESFLAQGDGAVIGHFADEISAIIQDISNDDKKSLGLEGVHEKSFAKLVKAQIFKADGTFHGTTISAKVRSKHAANHEKIEKALTLSRGLSSLKELNLQAKTLWLIYDVFTDEFLKLKIKNGYGEFSDALKGCYQLLCQQQSGSGALWFLSNKYQHILLDEFQDTSLLQWEVFKSVIQEMLTVGVERGITTTAFLVGDSKQSIYGFREAAPEVMGYAEQDLNSYGLRRLEMSTNWRSTSHIMDFVNSVFADNPGHIVRSLLPHFPVHRASSKNSPFHNFKDNVTILPLIQPNQSHDDAGESASLTELRTAEAKAVAAWIGDRLSQAVHYPVVDRYSGLSRPCRASDFAILYPQSTFAHEFEAALHELHIPTLREEERGFFQRPEIVDMEALVTLLTWPHSSQHYITLLKSPLINLSDKELLTELEKCDGSGLTQSKHPKIVALNQLLASAQSKILFIDKLWHVIDSTEFLRSYTERLGEHEGPLATANIYKFLETVRNFQSKGSGPHDELVQLLQELKTADETGLSQTDINAVRLMTIHKSKGLEFDFVVLTDTANDWFRAERYWQRSIDPERPGMHYIASGDERKPCASLITPIMNLYYEYMNDEKARLLYVALTRSRRYLAISGHFKPTKENPDLPAERYYSRLTEAFARANSKIKEIPNQGDLHFQKDLPTDHSNPITSRSSKRLQQRHLNGPLSPMDCPPIYILGPENLLPADKIDQPIAVSIARGESLDQSSTQGAPNHIDLCPTGPDGDSDFAFFGTSDSSDIPRLQGIVFHRTMELLLQDKGLLDDQTPMVHLVTNEIFLDLKDSTLYGTKLRHQWESAVYELQIFVQKGIQAAVEFYNSHIMAFILEDVVHFWPESQLLQLLTLQNTTPKSSFNMQIKRPDLMLLKNKRGHDEIWIVDFKTQAPSFENLETIQTWIVKNKYHHQILEYGQMAKCCFNSGPNDLVIRTFIFATSCNHLFEIKSNSF
jgi:ATP-dependent helicase/nuclease subunit A